MYVADFYRNAVLQFNVGPGGKLSLKSPARVAAGTRPLGVAVSPNGGSVYVTNTGSDNVSQYRVGPGGKPSPGARPGWAPAIPRAGWR